jgi:gamma-glutamyltranspeptidase
MVEVGMGEQVIAAVADRGVPLQTVSPWEIHMGSCQAIAIDSEGRRHAVADPRRLGRAAAY